MAISAKSKGYRKYNDKKKGYAWTDKEKKMIIYGGGAILLVLIIAVLWMPVYNLMTGVKVEQGVQVGIEDDWVTCNLGTQSKPKVVKLARVDQTPEGYEQTLAERSLYMLDRLEYEPVDKSAFPAEVILQGTKTTYGTACDNAYERVAVLGDALYTSDIVKGKLGGKQTAYFIRNYTNVVADESGAETTNTYQYLYGYVKCRRSDCCVSVLVGGRVDSEADFVADDVLVAQFEAFAKNMSMK